MNYENSVTTTVGEMKKKRNTMYLWQMIAISVLLVLVVSSMFVPVFRFSGSIFEESLKRFCSELDEETADLLEIDYEVIEGIASGEYDYDVQENINDIDDSLENEKIPTSISAFDIMTQKPDKFTQTSDIEDITESEISDSILRRINDDNGKYNMLRAGLWIAYIFAFLLLVPLFLGYFLHWNKFIFAGIGTAYGAVGACFFGCLRFGLAGSMAKGIVNAFYEEVQEYSYYYGMDQSSLVNGINNLGKPISHALSSYFSMGFLIAFILCILVAVMCGITMFVGNSGAKLQEPQGYAPGQPAPILNPNPVPAYIPNPPVTPPVYSAPPKQRQLKMGKVKCIEGASVGQGFMLPKDKKVVVGKSKVHANLVIDNKNVSNIHCSIKYNPVNNTYIVRDHSLNGTFVNGVKLQKDIEIIYPAGTILSLADGSNKILLG